MEPQKSVGQNIAAARKAAGLTQEALGDKAGMLAHEISRLERGVRDMRVTTLVKIATGLGVEASVLLEGVGPGHEKAPASDNGDEGEGTRRPG